MHKRTLLVMGAVAIGAWLAMMPLGAVPVSGRPTVAYAVSAVSGAPLVLSEFESGWAATRVVYTELGDVEVDGGRVVYSAPRDYAGVDHFGLVFCSPESECAFGSYEVTVRLPAKPLLGFGTPPRPVTSVGLSSTVEIGLDLIASTARLVALPLLALVLGVALFSVGGPGTPLFNASQVVRRRRNSVRLLTFKSILSQIGHSRAGQVPTPTIEDFATGAR